MGPGFKIQQVDSLIVETRPQQFILCASAVNFEGEKGRLSVKKALFWKLSSL